MNEDKEGLLFGLAIAFLIGSLFWWIPLCFSKGWDYIGIAILLLIVDGFIVKFLMGGYDQQDN